HRRLLYPRARVSLESHEPLARCSAAGSRRQWRERRDRDPQGLAHQVRARQGDRAAERRPRALQRGPLPCPLRLPARTYCEDGDALDALVLGQEPVVPLCVMRARPIGVMAMTDEKGRDDKIIAVHADDPEYAVYQDITDLPPHRLKEVERFFLDYKVLEDKTVKVEDMRGRADAARVIADAETLYAGSFPAGRQ